MTEGALTTFNRELETLNNVTETFATTLPPLTSSSDVNVHKLRDKIYAHTLVRMAFIHLNIKFATNDISANVRCVEAAITMVRLLDDVDLIALEILPPVVAVSAVILRMRYLTEALLECLADGRTSLNSRNCPPEHYWSTAV